MSTLFCAGILSPIKVKFFDFLVTTLSKLLLVLLKGLYVMQIHPELEKLLLAGKLIKKIIHTC